MKKTLHYVSRIAALILLPALLANLVSAQPLSQPPFTREAMLRDIAGKVLVPEWSELAGKCRDLTNSIGRLVERPETGALEQTRKAWLEASLAASHLRCFQAGPIADRQMVSTRSEERR